MYVLVNIAVTILLQEAHHSVLNLFVVISKSLSIEQKTPKKQSYKLIKN